MDRIFGCGGFHPHPSPLPSRERGPAVLHRWTGWTGWTGFWGEAGDGIATWFDGLGMILRQAQDERKMLAMTGCGGFHPHPSPLPSRERGPAVLHRWTGWTGFWGEAGDGIATWFDRLGMILRQAQDERKILGVSQSKKKKGPKDRTLLPGSACFVNRGNYSTQRIVHNALGDGRSGRGRQSAIRVPMA